MNTEVSEPDDYGHHLRWLNALHDPEQGVVVVHVAPKTTRAQLIGLVQHAIGRSPAAGLPGRRLNAEQWTTAWLSTARPRLDLVLYGAHRLDHGALDWTRVLSTRARANIWHVVPAEHPTGELRRWPWPLFRSHPWPDRTPTIPAAAINLPSFPFSHQHATGLPESLWAAALMMEVTYRAARVHIGVAGRSCFDGRTIAHGLAWLGLLPVSAAERCMLVRLLEHDVFLCDGTLRVDIDRYTAALDAHRGDKTPPDTGYPRRHADPLQAAGEIVALINSRQATPTVQRSSTCDVAADGSHLIDSDGRMHQVPPWYRWPLRAAVELQRTKGHYRAKPSISASSISIDLYDTELRARHPNQPDRFEIVALGADLRATFTLSQDVLDEPPLRNTRRPFGKAEADAIWDIHRAPHIHGHPVGRDEAVDWLLERGLASQNPDGAFQLAPWLRAAVECRPTEPRFAISGCDARAGAALVRPSRPRTRYARL